jgi:uncharacterized protein (TIGR02145 family)
MRYILIFILFLSSICNSQTFVPNYGFLYNFWAVDDARNIANAGWHVAIETDYIALENYTGGTTYGSKKLRISGGVYWNDYTTFGTNETNWNGRGSGWRYNGIFDYLKTEGDQWVGGSSFNSTYAYYFHLGANSNEYGSLSLWTKKTGMGIRLVRDYNIVDFYIHSDGEIGTYTGNDGKVYRTRWYLYNEVGYEWLTENLCETKYRNGDLITEVTDNTEWSNLTTEAFCAYDNDWNNAYYLIYPELYTFLGDEKQDKFLNSIHTKFYQK